MKTVRCISRIASGLTQVAIPALYVDPFDHGEERALPDEIADQLLRNPNFEEVQNSAPAALAPIESHEDY